MEKQTHKRAALGCGHIAAICVALALIAFFKLHSSGEERGPAAPLILVYSPYCPHCHELIEYLDEKGVNYTKTQNGKEAFETLSKYGIAWDGGVPLLYAVVNESVIAVEGFPSASQMKEGYFLGKEYEENLCNRLGGKAFYSNGTYLFCKMPTGLLLGNVYSVNYLLEKVE